MGQCVGQCKLCVLKECPMCETVQAVHISVLISGVFL